ncbi:hypothetical protein G9A89_012025 [Geosiphon pyriformis]|nr:hypothetical protein G9A89_012025 [Geosiphon pyriformis]
MNKFNGFRVFTSELNSGHMGSNITIVMNTFLARHVYKVFEVPGQLLFIKLLFKNKLSVSILGLYASAFLVAWFSQTGEINSLIAKTVNESSFIILGGDFNEDVMDHNVVDVNKHFDTNHWAVSVSVGLSSLLNTQLNSLCRQANRNYWKFDFKSANNSKWKNFKDATLANAGMFANEFATTVQLLDLNLLESRCAEETCIKVAINKRMESFESDKGHTIKSVLECLFCKVVLDYLVVGNELVLEPSLVKSRVDGIIKDWTRKHRPLEYVFDDAFSGMMCSVGVDELLGMVSNLPKGKAAGLSGILNKL